MGIDTANDKWIIGDIVAGITTNRVSVTEALNDNTTYHFKVLLQPPGTVTLVNNGQIKATYNFSSVGSGRVGLEVKNGSANFDNVQLYTEIFPTFVGNPPSIPPPTRTNGAPDLAAVDYSSPPFYYNLNDHLGTTRIVTNESGIVTGSFEYYPFGEAKLSEGCLATNQQFTGKLLDPESGLQYFGARYLSNDLTRFTSVDPARVSFTPMDPQGWNRYSYSQNNPINLIDPNGREIDFQPKDLETPVRAIMNSSPTLTKALSAYDGPKKKNLTITRADTDNKVERGDFDPHITSRNIDYPEDLSFLENLSQKDADLVMEANHLSSATFDRATITIDSDFTIGSAEFISILGHEASHASDAASNFTDFLRTRARELLKYPKDEDHDNRADESKANKMSRTVYEEAKK